MIYGDAGADPPRRASPGCSRRACDDAATRVQSCQLQQSVPLSLPSNPGCFMSRLLGDRVRSQRPRCPCRECAEFITNHTLILTYPSSSEEVQTPGTPAAPSRKNNMEFHTQPGALHESDVDAPAAQSRGPTPALPMWAKIFAVASLAMLLVLIVSGGAAAPSRPWLVRGGTAASGYFAAGTATAGIISCSSGLGIGFFSIGLVSFGVVGSLGVFSVGIFSIGFFSLGVFSVGHVALGVWAWGVCSRWLKGGVGFERSQVALECCGSTPEDLQPAQDSPARSRAPLPAVSQPALSV